MDVAKFQGLMKIKLNVHTDWESWLAKLLEVSQDYALVLPLWHLAYERLYAEHKNLTTRQPTALHHRAAPGATQSTVHTQEHCALAKHCEIQVKTALARNMPWYSTMPCQRCYR